MEGTNRTEQVFNSIRLLPPWLAWNSTWLERAALVMGPIAYMARSMCVCACVRVSKLKA